MAKRRRKTKPYKNPKKELARLIADQRADMIHDRLLTRVRSSDQKTTRHVDDLGRTAGDLAVQDKPPDTRD